MSRLRRSELSTPASSMRMIEKALGTEADLVFLDLEDSVAPSEKDAARANAITALNELDWGNKVRAVRINSLETSWVYADLTEIVERCSGVLDVIIVPKVLTAFDVRWVSAFLDQAERRLLADKPIALEVLIEETEGLTNVVEIARSSARLEALIFGPGDFSASQGVRANTAIQAFGPDFDVYFASRSQIVVAAKAAGIDAVDGPFAAFRDDAGYEREALRASALGYVGKWAIHPSQILPANAAFSPTAEEVTAAREIVTAYAEAQERGEGAISVNGKLVDAASIRLVIQTVERADAIGM